MVCDSKFVNDDDGKTVDVKMGEDIGTDTTVDGVTLSFINAGSMAK